MFKTDVDLITSESRKRYVGVLYSVVDNFLTAKLFILGIGDQFVSSLHI